MNLSNISRKYKQHVELCYFLTIYFGNFSTASTAIHLHTTTASNGALGITYILVIVSIVQIAGVEVQYLVLAKRKRHAFIIAADFNVAITKDLEGVGNRVLKLLIRLCGYKTNMLSVAPMVAGSGFITLLQKRKRWVAR